MQIQAWAMLEPKKPLERLSYDAGALADDALLVEVAGCGICHTDIGYLLEGVPVKKALPLVLGHEVSGVVVDAGSAARDWLGAPVVVAAVTPCGTCDACKRGRAGICASQLFVGNHVHGGFASHVVVPARGVTRVPESLRGDLPLLAVVGDAVTTAYNAVARAEVGHGNFAVFVGAGGVGAFGVQIARAKGAVVAALDVDADRLKLAAEHGAAITIDVSGKTAEQVKRELRATVKNAGLPGGEWIVFETSGNTRGQELAFSLINFGATLMVVGYAPADATVRLSNLMAYEARALGVWGCTPALYPEALALVERGAVSIRPFAELHPMSTVNEVIEKVHGRRLKRRPILQPDFPKGG